MIHINDNFRRLPTSYLFSEIAHKVASYESLHPDAHIIRMGIGDVTRPVPQAAVEGLVKGAIDEVGIHTFKGYGPEQGYEFLRSLIGEHDYRERGVEIADDEIFISDGAKSDTGNFGDILAPDTRIAVTDPVYPVYVDSNVMAGRAGELQPDGRWSRIIYLPCTAENDFMPELPSEVPDLIYLCYPNNPTGTALRRDQLRIWVDYARRNGALIAFDSAYEAYVTDTDVPRSIYEIEGAREVAVEFRSFSKTAGFTGLRLGYTVVPRTVTALAANGSRLSLRDLWLRRQTTKFNGASYVIQRAAEALYTNSGKEQVRDNIHYYMENAAMMRDGLSAAGFDVYGGVNSPYLWVRTPGGMKSWELFEIMLDRCNIVVTPGCGFGPSGEGYFRLTAFNTHANTREAIMRIREAGF